MSLALGQKEISRRHTPTVRVAQPTDKLVVSQQVARILQALPLKPSYATN